MSPNRTQRPMLRSCLYAGSVLHERRAPRQHRFRHGLFLAYLDLDELGELDGALRLLSRNRRNLYEFRDADHLPFPRDNPKPDLRDAVAGWIESQGVSLPPGSRIALLTLPRVAGYVFNPVSFYFVHDSLGAPVVAVAEVGNTFGELKPYLIPPDPGGDGFRRVVPKHFYVSPFSGLDLRFDFRLRAPDGHLDIAVDDLGPDGGTVLISRLTGSRRPLDDATLLRLTARYPLVTLRVITLIHWHALRLWAKRVPWHRKSDRPDSQRDLYPSRTARPTPASPPVFP